MLFNKRIETRPAILCRCTGTDDVVEVVRIARDAGLPVAIRGGGRHTCGFSLVESGVVIDVPAMNGVRFDPLTATVVAEAGQLPTTVPTMYGFRKSSNALTRTTASATSRAFGHRRRDRSELLMHLDVKA